jgi:cell fate (sporulation/competence/biofilm development) regulator YlbF (YheA/YmcA/DUF963 family)
MFHAEPSFLYTIGGKRGIIEKVMQMQMTSQVSQSQSLDVHALVCRALELADLIKQSEDVRHYLARKQQLEDDAQIVRLRALFAEKKAAFMACERFGHFHPDYHRAFDEVVAVRDSLEQLEPMIEFKEAERSLDELLFDVSKTIARAVSETIMVPTDLEQATTRKSCADGGCSGKCS